MFQILVIILCFLFLSWHNGFGLGPTPKLPTLELGSRVHCFLDYLSWMTHQTSISLAAELITHMHAPNSRSSPSHAVMTSCACHYSRTMLDSNCLVLVYNTIWTTGYMYITWWRAWGGGGCGVHTNITFVYIVLHMANNYLLD